MSAKINEECHCQCQTINIKKITEAVVKDITRNFYLVPRIIKAGDDQKVEFLEYIVQFVSAEMKIAPEIIRSSARSNECVEARSMYFYLANKYCKATGMSQDLMGSFVGRDHSTVIHALRKVKNEMSNYRHYKKEVERLDQNFFDKHKRDIFLLEHPIPES